MQSVYIADGDSITNQNGGASGGSNANRFPDQALAQMNLYSSYNATTGQTPQILYFDVAIGGQTCQNRIDAASLAVDPFFGNRRKFSVVSINCGINDWKAGTHDENVTYAQILTYVAARKAAGWASVIVLTMEDDIVPIPQPAFTTYRHALNTLIINGAVANGYTVMDIAADATMGCDGCAANTTYFRDGEHPTVVGYTIFANLLHTTLTAMGFN